MKMMLTIVIEDSAIANQLYSNFESEIVKLPNLLLEVANLTLIKQS